MVMENATEDESILAKGGSLVNSWGKHPQRTGKFHESEKERCMNIHTNVGRLNSGREEGWDAKEGFRNLNANLIKQMIEIGV